MKRVVLGIDLKKHANVIELFSVLVIMEALQALSEQDWYIHLKIENAGGHGTYTNQSGTDTYTFSRICNDLPTT